MNRTVQFLGILALVTLIFGVFSNLLIAYDDFFLVPIHIGVAGLCLLIFVIRGGLGFLGSEAAKRAAGFGAGVTAYSLVFVGLLIFANYFAARHEFLQYDSTEQNVFTLAPQTQQVLSKLTQPVIARAFFVGKVDAETENLLNRFAKASHQFRWTWIDPEKKPLEMEKYGISESKIVHFSFESGQPKSEAKISRTINEQEIVNALRKLAREGERTVYYLQGHGEGDLDSPTDGGFLFLKEAIQGENVQVKKLSIAESGKVPPDAGLLLMIAPKKSLLPPEKAAIEDYLKAGGNAVFLNEPRTTSDIADLVKPLGINVGNDIVLDQVVRMFAGPGIGVQPMVTNYGSHQATKGFTEGTVFSTVTSVTRAANVPENAQVTELALTSANSWAEKDIEKVFSDKPIASRDADDIRGPVGIVAAFEGVYPKGQFQRASDDAASKPAEEPKGKKSRVIVIGDSDFVANVNIRSLYNSDFFLGLVNWTLGEDGGVTISARTLRQSRNVLSDEQFGTIFVLSGIVFPELLLIVGLGVWWFRKK